MADWDKIERAGEYAADAVVERFLHLLEPRFAEWAPQLVGLSADEVRQKLDHLIRTEALPLLDQVDRETMAELLAASHGSGQVRFDVLKGFAEKRAREDNDNTSDADA